MAEMQFDLPQRFDNAVADEGVWFEIYDENDNHWGDFKCALLDNDSRRIKLVQDRIKAKYQREIRTKKVDYTKLGREVFLECVLLDWKGVKGKGKDIAFSAEAARAYFENEGTKYVLERLLAECQDVTNYQRVDKDEVAGN